MINYQREWHGNVAVLTVFKDHAEAAVQLLNAGWPIPMVLHCPACGLQHIDAPHQAGDGTLLSTWTNPPHRSHLCHGCGHVWRPADVATTGVAKVQTKGTNDCPPVQGRPGIAAAWAQGYSACTRDHINAGVIVAMPRTLNPYSEEKA